MILFSLFVGVIALPILLRRIESTDHVQQRKEERLARAATADVAIVAIQKMEDAWRRIPKRISTISC